MTLDDEGGIPPLRKTVEVPGSREAAFRLFTEQLGQWWPSRTHSVGLEAVEAIVFEPRVGGRVFERWANGEEHTWGTVTEWRPPDFFQMTWHPGRESRTAQDVAVYFHAVGDATRIELVQSGWERYGDGALEQRERYDHGWSSVFAGLLRFI
jgi:hypothetical protein